jgi:hypothetical protein
MHTFNIHTTACVLVKQHLLISHAPCPFFPPSIIMWYLHVLPPKTSPQTTNIYSLVFPQQTFQYHGHTNPYDFFKHIYICLPINTTSPQIYTYTGCNRGNGPDFGRVFLMLNYTEKIQNNYIRSWTVTEIMAIEMSVLLGFPRTLRRPWRHARPQRMRGNETS